MSKSKSWEIIIILLLTIGILSCEKTKIYAQKSDDRVTVNQLALLLCQSDEDCPQWDCVKSSCEVYEQPYSPYDGQKLCLPKRKSIKLQSGKQLNEDKITEVTAFDLSVDAEYLYTYDAMAKQVVVYQRDGKNWGQKDLFDVGIDQAHDLVAGPENTVFLLQGNQAILFDIQSRLSRSYTLASEGKSLLVDEAGLWWASIGVKGLELILPENSDEMISASNEAREANPRFETAGNAIKALSSKSYMVVADQFAGLSSFLKKSRGGLESGVGARSLQTPAQELSTHGQVMDIAMAEQRVISAEYGAGLGVLELSAQGGLLRNHQLNFDAHVTAVALIDPFTAFVVTENKQIFLVDLLQFESLNEAQKELSFDQNRFEYLENNDAKRLVELGMGENFKQISTIKWATDHVYWLDSQDRSLYSLELLCE